MAETGHQERRQHKRISFIKNVKMRGFGLLQCLNLSVGGMYLTTIIPFYVKEAIFEIQFKLYEIHENIINVQAYAVNHRRGGIGVGFINLKIEDRQRIEEFIARE
jgi:hypothetical protein